MSVDNSLTVCGESVTVISEQISEAMCKAISEPSINKNRNIFTTFSNFLQNAPQDNKNDYSVTENWHVLLKHQKKSLASEEGFLSKVNIVERYNQFWEHQYVLLGKRESYKRDIEFHTQSAFPKTIKYGYQLSSTNLDNDINTIKLGLSKPIPDGNTSTRDVLLDMLRVSLKLSSRNQTMSPDTKKIVTKFTMFENLTNIEQILIRNLYNKTKDHELPKLFPFLFEQLLIEYATKFIEGPELEMNVDKESIQSFISHINDPEIIDNLYRICYQLFIFSNHNCQLLEELFKVVNKTM